jgi:hypothetical protein
MINESAFKYRLLEAGVNPCSLNPFESTQWLLPWDQSSWKGKPRVECEILRKCLQGKNRKAVF